jgi:CRISPR-associated protein Cas5t
MLSLYIEAPFGVCRTFTAGWYRPTATFLTPSTAYGLLLNLSGIETRLREEHESHSGKVPATLMRSNLPMVKLALGVPTTRLLGRETDEAIPETARYPRVQTVYQQLHNYPVGSSGGDRAASTFGNKYNITPVRREMLVALRAVVAINGNSELEELIRRGLSGELATPRYGLPFVGDNSFLPDRIEILDHTPQAHWYERVTPDESAIRPRTTRLTIWIDRADLSRTRSELYAPGQPQNEVPPLAWTDIAPH